MMLDGLSRFKFASLIFITAILVWSIGLPGFSVIPNLILLFFTLLLLKKHGLPIIKLRDFNFLLCAYSLLILSVAWFLIIADSAEFQVFRMARFFISGACIWVILNIWKVAFGTVVKILLIVLLFHALALALQIFSFPLKLWFAAIVGVETELFEFRGFGLTTAYDTAGAYICFAILFLYASKLWTPWIRFGLLLGLWALGLSTGRTFFLIGTVITLSLLCHVMCSRESSKSERIIGLSGLLVFLAVVVPLWAIYGDLVIDTTKTMFALDSALSGAQHSESGYNLGSGNVLLDMFYFPLDKEIEYLIGTGQTHHSSDIGFLKTFYTYGIFVGTLMSSFMLVILYFVGKMFSEIKLSFVGVFFAGLIIVYNIKMQSFFSSGYSEIIFLLLYSYRPRLSSFDKGASSVESDMNTELQLIISSSD